MPVEKDLLRILVTMPAKSKEHFWKSQYGKSSKLEEV